MVTKVMNWFDDRLPLTATIERHLTKYPAPINMNIWYLAGVIDMQLGQLDDLQKRGNQYVHSDCFLKPQSVVNFLKRNHKIEVKDKQT